MSLFKTVDSENYGIINIGSVAKYGYTTPNIYQIHPESSDITILSGDIEQRLRGLMNDSYRIPSNAFGYVRTERTLDELNSSTVRDYLDGINNHTLWLWGDLYKGGVGFIVNYNGRAYQIINSYGKLFNPNTNKYIYGLYTSQGIASFDADRMPQLVKSIMFAYHYSYHTGTLNTPEYYSIITGGYDSTRGNPFYMHLVGYPNSYDKPIKYIGSMSGIYPSYSYSFTNAGEVDTFPIDKSFLGYTYGVISTDPLQVYFAVHVVNNGWTDKEAIYFQELPPSPYQLTDGDIWGNGEIPPQPNTGGGTSGGGGGGGTFDNTSDVIPVVDPSQFEVDALDTGFVALYNPSKAELVQLAQFLYSGITDSISNQLKKLLANPLDYLVSLNMVHLPLEIAETDTIKFASVSTGVVMGRLGKQFVTVYGGYFDIDEQFMSFLDYGRNVELKISIPYCGIFPLPINKLMGGRLHLYYKIDLLTGAMTADLQIGRQRSYVKIGGKTEAEQNAYIGSYSGNCFIPVPIASVDYRNAVNALLGMTSGLATSVATGNPLPLISSSANAVVNSRQDFAIGGNIGNNYGYMTTQDAFLIIENPVQNLPINYPYYEGYPSNIRVSQLRKVTGYVEVEADTFWCGSLTNPYGTITSEEAQELKQIMNGGIWI